MSFLCVLFKSLLCLPLWCLSRVRSFLSTKRASVSIQLVHLLCLHTSFCPNLNILVTPPPKKKNQINNHNYFLSSTQASSCHEKHTRHMGFCSFASTKIFVYSELRSFVSVYVIAWQGSAPVCLCDGLNVIHWAETFLLPASLPFCLHPLLVKAQYKRG